MARAEFAILYAGALLGAAAIAPCGLRLIERSGRLLAISPVRWLFWTFGIEAAIAAHFTADIVYHVGGMLLRRANDQLGVLPWLRETGWRE